MAKIIIHAVSRRNFIKTTGLAAGGLLLQGCMKFSNNSKESELASLNAFIKIDMDNKVTLIVHQAEMGQGASTTLPAILADELGADWSNVLLENSLTDPAFKNPKYDLQFTGNAESIRGFHDILRKTAATAREMLKQAAATQWNVPKASLRTENSYIIGKNGEKATFGEFAVPASKLPAPKNVKLKPQTEWKLTGNKSLPRVDIPEKVNGKAVFGIDVELPDMLYASIEICPYFGGRIKEIHENGVRKQSGFVEFFKIPVANPVVAYPPGFNKQEAVAVVAKSYWQSRRALDTLKIVYDKGVNQKMDSKSLYAIYEKTLKGKKWHESVKEGTPIEQLEKVEKTHKAQYYSAWQSHATMEPMNATAKVKGDKVEIWAPTQGQEMAQILISKEFNIPKENITVHRTYLGGGFGRRLLADYVFQAVFLSKKTGKPVKLIWTREQDMQHDFYRPGTMQEFEASVDDTGMPIAMRTKLVSPTILQAVTSVDYVFEGEDPSFPEGIKEIPYHIKNRLLETNMLRLPPPTSVWRTTGFGPNVFALESFLDELAAKAGEDPIAYRKKLVADARSTAVLDLAAKASNWNKPRKKNQGLGVALTHSFESFVAQVVDVSIGLSGILTINKITTVVDCGTVLDPGIARASIESGLVWGLSAALNSEINFKEGRTVESNFNEFKMLTMPEFDIEIETLFINSGEKIGGIAESGPIPIAPALCNAIFDATRKRYRTLPLGKHGVYTQYSADLLPVSTHTI
ncbi:xanthine dehydrogenase family protein molybdopterin-binding subunit [Aquimarina sp. U1-2]|uniref:xanthine dehydrogenase family protein molybdopterin-binding subunit n=1 Tax=Aquimarina sp. U1-2 TaxID=2823141 RepID=UPI001AEC8610|nr:molybdopterin cofactor-binding domain-containing protein [Aquimarina sp. U1-2]MBP2831854.1 xanthine dehydrogenase family protein molybdopterin-binding subunit [Aquimarina sp. U1-2]